MGTFVPTCLIHVYIVHCPTSIYASHNPLNMEANNPHAPSTWRFRCILARISLLILVLMDRWSSISFVFYSLLQLLEVSTSMATTACFVIVGGNNNSPIYESEVGPVPKVGDHVYYSSNMNPFNIFHVIWPRPIGDWLACENWSSLYFLALRFLFLYLFMSKKLLTTFYIKSNEKWLERCSIIVIVRILVDGMHGHLTDAMFQKLWVGSSTMIY
jgi:hypothetical protein